MDTFKTGVRAIFYHVHALKFLRNHHHLIKYFLYPLAINLVVFSILFAGVLYFYGDWLTGIVTPGEAWYWSLLYGALIVLTALVFVLLMFFTFSIVGSIIAAPFNDMLSQQTEEIFFETSLDEPFSWEVFWRDIGNTIVEQVQRLAFLLTIWLLVLPTLIIPLVGQIIVACVTFLLLAFEYLDLPLSRRRLKFREKRRILWKHKFGMLGFGTACGLLLAIPFINVLSIPLSVIAGTLFYCERVANSDSD